MTALVDTTGIVRFVRYSGIGISTFLLDLALLFILIDFFGVHYVLSSGIAFIIAVSLNYALARRYVFQGTERGLESGYIMFIGIAAFGLFAVMALMYLAVDVWGFGYVVSRIFIACVVGMWTYCMNLYMNFRMAGKQ